MAKVELFVSYAREDEGLVTNLVRFLQLASDAIFYDGHITPGEEWESRLLVALEEALTLVVFWCRHTKGSEWVKREYTEAIRLSKRVVPVLLDNTAIPEELSRFQWLDFRFAHPTFESQGISTNMGSATEQSCAQTIDLTAPADHPSLTCEQWPLEEYGRQLAVAVMGNCHLVVR